MTREEIKERLLDIHIREDTLLSRDQAKRIRDRIELQALIEEEKELNAELKRLGEPNNLSVERSIL